MVNTLCTECSGRGFHWRTVGLTKFVQGPTCQACKGTGKVQGYDGWAIVVVLIAIVIAAVFIISPLVHMALDAS